MLRGLSSVILSGDCVALRILAVSIRDTIVAVYKVSRRPAHATVVVVARAVQRPVGKIHVMKQRCTGSPEDRSRESNLIDSILETVNILTCATMVILGEMGSVAAAFGRVQVLVFVQLTHEVVIPEAITLYNNKVKCIFFINNLR